MRSTSHHGFLLRAVCVVLRFGQYPLVLPSLAREASPPCLVDDCLDGLFKATLIDSTESELGVNDCSRLGRLVSAITGVEVGAVITKSP